MKILLIVLFSVLAFAGTALAQGNLRPGDTIEIRISGVPSEDVQQWSAPYTIDPSGFLNLPYISQVKAGGLQPNQVQTLIESKLKEEKIYTQPTISVLIQAQSRFVNVGGSVRAPGRIPYTPDLTLMSAINAAGGFNDFADQKKIRFVHDGKMTVIDARKIRKDPKLDLPIYPGDQIEVPQSWF